MNEFDLDFDFEIRIRRIWSNFGPWRIYFQICPTLNKHFLTSDLAIQKNVLEAILRSP